MEKSSPECSAAVGRATPSSRHNRAPSSTTRKQYEDVAMPFKPTFEFIPTPGDTEAEPFPMVISANVHGYLVKHILVDQGSSVNVLHYHTFSKMGGRYEDLQPSSLTMVSFNAEEHWSRGWHAGTSTWRNRITTSYNHSNTWGLYKLTKGLSEGDTRKTLKAILITEALSFLSIFSDHLYPPPSHTRDTPPNLENVGA
ncbi:hypothetical protein G2W53_007520 [Senna tora]|uniref:Uncharacterized protein n=1 Tax=Senna tora TaxID=362788 RepID=A0A834X7R8_9FABA|nr:hypothetical protein G2W53_007520 [Senna tora]